MGAEAMGLQIPVGMSLDEAQLALRQLEQLARETGKKVQQGFKPATEAADGFSSSISKWRKDEMQEGRRVGFLVDQFTAGLVPATGAAREGVNLLTKALIGGFGLGLALDAAGAGARLLVEWWEKEEKAEAGARASAEAHRRALLDLADETDAYVRSVAGTTAALEFLHTKRKEFDSKNAGDLKRLDDLNALVFDNERQGITTTNDLLKERAELTKKVEGAQASWNAAVQASFETRRAADARKHEEEIAKVVREARITADNKLFEERYNAEQAHRAKMKEMRSQVERNEIQAELDADAAFASARAERMLKKEQEERDAAKALRNAYNAADDAEFISHYEMKLATEQAYIDIENRMFEEAYNERLTMERQASQYGADMYKSFAQSAVGEFGKIITSSRAYNSAMKAAGKATTDGADLSAAAFAAMAQSAISATAQKAAVEALWELGQGLAATARSFWDPRASAEAGLHFSAAATYGSIAGVAGAAAYMIGQNRGTTRAERASIGDPALPKEDPLPAPSGPREVGGSAGGTVTVRETIFVIGPPGMTEAEMARITARSLEAAKRLDMLART
jgi:hypothetical protein